MMKMTTMILGALVSFNVSAAQYVVSNASYELVGPSVCTSENSMEITAVVHDKSGSLIGSAFVTCEVFQKLNSCASRTGTMTYDDGISPGYDFPDSVVDFTCQP